MGTTDGGQSPKLLKQVRLIQNREFVSIRVHPWLMNPSSVFGCAYSGRDR